MKKSLLLLLAFLLASCSSEKETPQGEAPAAPDANAVSDDTSAAEVQTTEAASPSLSAFAGKVSGDLVRLSEGELVPATAALNGKDLVAVYYSAHWCPPCRAFTPELSAFYDKAVKDYPNFQMIFMSSDRSADAMKEYMEWGKMNFPAVKYAQRGGSGLGELAARGIPYLIVLDAEGNQILGKDPGENWKAPQLVLAELKDLLKSKG